jgi:DNA polymerase-3 subunit gamma/tau
MIIRRETKMGSNDLNVVYRPCIVDEIIGNETSKRIIKNSLDSGKVPHTQLFTGDAGCGKTTAAKIMALGLNCETNGVSSNPCLKCNSCRTILEGNNIDVKEINVGQTGGKDYVDAIVRDLPMAPFNTRYRILIFDEAHELTTAAKDLLLKPTEHGYEHVYFIFCTNQPERLRSKVKDAGEAFLRRCFSLEFKRVSPQIMKELLQNVCEFEGFQFNPEILDLIAEEANGVPGNALVWLSQIAAEDSWTISVAKEVCKAGIDETDPQVIELFRALNKGSFKEAIDIFGTIKTMPVESMRIGITGLFVGCLKRSKKMGDGHKFSKVLDVLTTPIYEQGKLAEHKWYNYMFKVTDIIMESNRRN